MRFSERDSREDEADRKKHDRDMWRLFRADVEFAVYRRGGDVYSLDRDWLHDAMLAGKSVEETADAALARQRRSVEAYHQQRRVEPDTARGEEDDQC